ncbi:hypothetical protein DNHGIG_11730 [Collibacillus ludicampi]|uniref:Uncharacterized protein n=2 Tax=Collibacillus ludicampi TaxID=2771369 RepID=A0AAV4LD39_9BACL|nr:hypothetical protein DNHGIG_11730 [Collibacillus ludicampi]
MTTPASYRRDEEMSSTIIPKQNSWSLVSDVLFKAQWMRFLPLDGMIVYPLLIQAATHKQNLEEVVSYLKRHLVFQKDKDLVNRREAELRLIYERSGYSYPETVEELLDLIIRFGLLRKITCEDKTRLALIDCGCIPSPENVLNLTRREIQILEAIRTRS